MTNAITDFIGVFSNAYSSEFCEQAINTFKMAEQYGFTVNRQEHGNAKKTAKDTNSLFISAETSFELLHTAQLSSEFGRIFWSEVYPAYASKYSILEDMDPHRYYCLKMQNTKIGGGYHIWHQENSVINQRRLINFMLYLNTVEDGGETEFLYYSRRIKPEMGKIIIYPAGYTHTHRGNPPLSNEKFVINGWLEF
ncbi:MAG: Synechococcus phage [Pseudomonadota bacterium]|jgi:hypothetical protein